MVGPRDDRGELSPSAPQAASSPRVLTLRGRIAANDVPFLCARWRVAIHSADGEVLCDAGGLIDADVAAVDAIARLWLAARRLGRELTVRNASPDLLQLLALCGLAGVVTPAKSGVEMRRQAEEREEAGGVEEERDPADPPT